MSAQQQVVQRNFTPQLGSYGDVGATGLQNLGNTCYMNSIIQCLLNLEEFCKYFKSNFYKKHLNRYVQSVSYSSAYLKIISIDANFTGKAKQTVKSPKSWLIFAMNFGVENTKM